MPHELGSKDSMGNKKMVIIFGKVTDKRSVEE
jgi:hypothetical protein